MVTDRANITIAGGPAHRKSLFCFQTVYLHLILVRSKGQSQGQIMTEYLVNGDIGLLTFDWHIYS